MADDHLGDPTMAGNPSGAPALPPGSHPLDPSVPYTPGLDSNAPVPDDTPHAVAPGTRPFPLENSKAIGVFQRAASDWTTRVVKLDANNAGTALVVGRVRGRVEVTLAVPTTLSDGTTPLGVVYGPTEAEVQQGIPSVLNPGDSITLRTEASVWVGVIGTNATGAVQVTVMHNPAGGGAAGD